MCGGSLENPGHPGVDNGAGIKDCPNSMGALFQVVYTRSLVSTECRLVVRNKGGERKEKKEESAVSLLSGDLGSGINDFE